MIRDPQGRIKAQSEVTPNQNTIEGAILFLDTYYSGVNYTAGFFAGLCVGAVHPNAGDTAAKITTGVPNPPTTNNWQETTAYAETTRQVLVFGSVVFGAGHNLSQSVDNSASPCVFTMTAAGVLGGGFLVTDSGKGAATGTLYCVDNGAGLLAFSAGDIVQVTVFTGFGSSPA